MFSRRFLPQNQRSISHDQSPRPSLQCRGRWNDRRSGRITPPAAAAAAGGDELIFPAGYTFAVSGYIIVENGVKVLRGLGGIIKLSAPGGIRLKGIRSNAAANVTDLLITGLILDANDQLSVGIDGENVSRVRIVRNVFLNFSVPDLSADPHSAAIRLRSWTNGVDHPKTMSSNSTRSTPFRPP